MAVAQLEAVRKVFDRVRDQAGGGDGDLLLRYRRERDQEAFGSLVRRHGPMVLGVCRRVLRNEHAAEDAFQATFVVLAQRADAVRPPERLAPWLYGVAYRTALKARGRAFRRARVERDYATEVANRAPGAGEVLPDVRPVIDEQLNALPEKYRAPLVLCALNGLNKREAAQRLGVPEGTVSSRLARARELLRDRLARRGVVVPAAALAAALSPNALCAAVPPALTRAAAGFGPVPASVLSLSNEVLSAMTWLKVQALGAVAVTVALAGGLFAVPADEKQPAQPPAGEKPAKPGTKPGDKPGEKPANPAKPDGEKPGAPRVLKLSGKIGGVDAKENTITLATGGDNGVVEKVFPLAADAKVTVDGKSAKLADVPVNAIAGALATAAKEGERPRITELRVTGDTLIGLVSKVDGSALTVDAGGKEKPRPVTARADADTRVTVGGKPAQLADLKPGDKVAVTLASRGAVALSVTAGGRGERANPGDGEKPRPEARGFAGKIEALDAATRTVTLAAKGEGGRALQVKLLADAKIVIDGKPAKFDDLKKGALATFTLTAAKDGQPREAGSVVVSGPTFAGTVKRADAGTITVGNEKADRVFKLAPGGKVLFGAKEGRFGDVKAGDRVTVTLASDDSGAVLIVVGAKREGGDK